MTYLSNMHLNLSGFYIECLILKIVPIPSKAKTAIPNMLDILKKSNTFVSFKPV